MSGSAGPSGCDNAEAGGVRPGTPNASPGVGEEGHLVRHVKQKLPRHPGVAAARSREGHSGGRHANGEKRASNGGAPDQE
eukprot:6777115-Alexandrium_andersonii.AAC.1